MIRITLSDGFIAPALYDTGSAINCVSVDFVNKRRVPILPLDRDDFDMVQCANRERIKIHGKILLKFSIEGVKMESFFHVMPSLTYNIILGTPFMHETSCVHSYNDRTVTLFGGLVTTYLYDNTETVGLALLTKYTRIPANCEVIVPIKFNAMHMDSVLLIEPVKEATYTKRLQGLLVARVLLAKDGPKRCRLLNLGDNTIRLRPNTVIASVSRIEDIVANLSQTSLSDKSLSQTNSLTSINAVIKDSSTQTQVDKDVDSPTNATPGKNTQESALGHNKTIHERKYTLEQLGITIENDSLTETEKKSFYDLIDKYNHIFALSNSDLPITDRGELHLRLKQGAVPYRAKPFHQSAEARAQLELQVQELLRNKWIERSTSPWSANSIMVRKKDQSYRVVFDYRVLNDSLLPERHPLVSIDEVKDVLAAGKPKIFSSIDLKSGYHSLGLDKDSRELTAFRANGALYQHTRCPEGVASAPATYSRLMNLILAEEKPGLPSLVGKRVLNYLDDVLITSADPKRHLQDLENVFIRLQDAKLRLSPKKCQFCRESVEYLGQSISATGLSPLKPKLEKLSAIPAPKNAKQLKIYLGAMGYYRRYLPLFGRLHNPVQISVKVR